MRPKEKAWELYNKYRTLEGKFGDKVLYNYDAKQCALIAVDEILNINNIKPYILHKEIIEFYQEVKQEIKNL
jgi:hypothetical protein